MGWYSLRISILSQVASAGNDGSEENINPTQNGFDGIGHIKNNLVVANANDVIYYSNGVVTQQLISSSKGPSDDGRINRILLAMAQVCIRLILIQISKQAYTDQPQEHPWLHQI